MTTHLEIKNASLIFDKTIIFSQLNLKLQKGKWLSLLGQSGIGKSSLLRMIAGFQTSKNQSYETISSEPSIPLSDQIAYMAQRDLLLPWLTVLGNATLKLKLKYHSRKERVQKLHIAHALLEKVGLSDYLHLYPKALSLGMRQRVALIRTLMEDKPIVLMDEPFSALDAITRFKLQNLAALLLQNKTVLFITHDPMEALRLSHEIVIMQGKPATLKHVISLDTKPPRELMQKEILSMQALLYEKLSSDDESIILKHSNELQYVANI